MSIETPEKKKWRLNLLEEQLGYLNKSQLCAIIEATGLSAKACWDETKSSKEEILNVATNRIYELIECHWKEKS